MFGGWLLAAGLGVGGDGPGAVAGGDGSVPGMLASRWSDEARKSDPRALDRVIGEYAQHNLGDTMRGLLVSTVTDAATGLPAFARFHDWREKNDAPRDAWLWYRTLLAEYESDPAVVREAAASPHGAVARAGAIHALAAWADPEALDSLPAAIFALLASNEKTVPKSVLIEAWAHVLASQPGRAGTPEFAAAAEALIPFLSDPAVESRTHWAVARALGRAFETEKVSFDPRWWRALLARVEPSKNPEDERYAAPTTTYFDLRATGDRIVYVLDMSGSMTSPLSAAALAELHQFVVAEPTKVGAGRADIAWKDVHTSLEAVVEFTKLSIRRLPKDASFCVVLFGTAAQALGATPGLMPASPGNVATAARDLDVLAKGTGSGGTNFHGGVRRAFFATLGGKDLDPGRSLDPLVLFAKGPTTIFVLSDGSPTHDDWSGGGGAGIGSSIFSATDGICDDVERANLLQRCEIHTLAFGMAGNDLLERLARTGGGHCRSIGGPAGAGGRFAGPAQRAFGSRDLDIDALLRRLGIPSEADAPSAVPAAPDPAMGDAPPAAPAPLDTAALLRQKLAGSPSADDRILIACALVERGDKTMLPVLLEALSESSERLAGYAEATLCKVLKHSFGWNEGLRRHERIALRRNWTWFAKSPKAAIPMPPEPRPGGELGK
jgi:hypothetical protein